MHCRAWCGVQAIVGQTSEELFDVFDIIVRNSALSQVPATGTQEIGFSFQPPRRTISPLSQDIGDFSFETKLAPQASVLGLYRNAL